MILQYWFFNVALTVSACILLKRQRGYKTLLKTKKESSLSSAAAKQQDTKVESGVYTHPDVQSQCVSAVLSESGENMLSQSSALCDAVCIQRINANRIHSQNNSRNTSKEHINCFIYIPSGLEHR